MKSFQPLISISFTFLMLSLTLTLTACKAGDGKGLDDQGRPLEETPDAMLPIDPPIDDNKIKATLASIQEHVFTPLCSSCHGGANPAAGQDLSSVAKSVENLINVQSSNTLFKRVLPGSAEQSYLYLKITGNNQTGSRMPLGQPALEQEQIEAIKNWINEGALVPESSAVSARVSRVSVSHTSNNNRQRVINFTFNKKMAVSQTNKDQILVYVSQNKDFSADNAWLLADNKFSINWLNNVQLQVRINLDDNVELPSFSSLRIELNQTNISTITTVLGQELDGNNDGLEGGAYIYDLSL